MDQALLFQELEALAAELEVDVRYEDLASRGGLCRVGDRTYLFVNRSLSLVERRYSFRVEDDSRASPH